MKSTSDIPADIGLTSETSFYMYVEETITYFSGLGIDIQRVIERTAKDVKHKLIHYGAGDKNEFFIDLASRISTGVVRNLERRNVEPDLEQLLDFSMRASIIAGTYAVAEGDYGNFNNFMIANYLEKV